MPEKHPVTPFLKILIGTCGWLLGMAPALALALPVQLCPTQSADAGPDGRVLGHLPYGQGAEADMVVAPPGFGINGPCKLQRAAAVDLTRLLQAADAVPEIAGIGVALKAPLTTVTVRVCVAVLPAASVTV